MRINTLWLIKLVFSLYAYFFISAYCVSQNTFIPDDNFEQALIDLGYDSGPLDDFVPTGNINTITDLNVSSKNISDLTGIEDFIALSVLNCSKNQLINIDTSNNSNLTQLFIDSNHLANINISNNLFLQILWCTINQLINLDVTNNPELISLKCSGNNISNIDISNNTKLNVFICTANEITSIDISKNILLDIFFCDNNLLTNIDTSNNLDLRQFNCGTNLITSLDLSLNTKLTHFWCASNQLTSIDVTNNINLQELSIDENEIAFIDTSNNSELIIFNSVNNILSALDLSSNTKLERINCVDNSLCFVNIKNGNNSIITSFETTLNPFLSCIFVDDVTYSSTNWLNIDSTTNFVLSQSECDALGNGAPDVDILNNFIGSSYTLPLLINGSYFTESNGGGQQLLPGTIITANQTIYIFNSTQCYTNESNFSVTINTDDYFIPKYFTPNKRW